MNSYVVTMNNKKNTPITSVRSCGPATAELFAKCDIHTAEQLIELGADESYSRLMRAGVRPHFICYYALVMGLQGRPWRDCQGEEKAKLRIQFDALKDKNFDAAKNEFEAMLDEMGVR